MDTIHSTSPNPPEPQPPEAPLSRGQSTRQAILNAAFELFISQGFHGTSMRQIAKRSQTSLSGIYNHFENKEQIFETVLMERHPYHHVLQVLSETHGETVEDFFRKAAEVILEEVGRRPEFFNLAFIAVTEFRGKHVPAMVRTIMSEFMPLVERFIAARGQLRDLPPMTIMSSFYGSLMAYYLSTQFVFPDNPNPPPVDPHLEIFLHGALKKEQP